MIAPQVFFLAAALMFTICVLLSALLVMLGQDNGKWWDRVMTWTRVSVALGIITGFLTLALVVVR